jgi:type III restriction enzyme
MKFNFEKNLNHQTEAVDSTLAVFEGVPITEPIGTEKVFVNPKFLISDRQYIKNIFTIQEKNQIEEKPTFSNIIDIMMETGTGKTYTYTKTIFELNKYYGIFKFIVIVPTLSIKAGTVDFMRSVSSQEHFKEQYGKRLQLHIVASQKNSKSKSTIPTSITSFVNAGNFEKDSIQVLIINAGMINSETLQKSFDKMLFDKFDVPIDAIAATNPFVIIDEPHKFTKDNKTWGNIQKLHPQAIFRYGATFPDKEILKKDPLQKKPLTIKIKDYHNLVYTLTAVDSFNRNLVKGVIGHITEFDSGKNVKITLKDTDGKEGTFVLNENGKITTKKFSKKDSLVSLHNALVSLTIDDLNKNTVILSNGMELKKGNDFNPFSFAMTLQETMIQNAIKHHFEKEKEFLTRDIRIKPLTLFFIDNIDEYRNQNGQIRTLVETYTKAIIKEQLETEENEFYRAYLENSLQDVSKTHGGYFSKDNTSSDEIIEKEINEILHDKEAILDLNNPRRFIFSKWTLREGWDNPNVFQICKLRSSGSEISKLQEVGRGLRLPVNEFGNRVKDEQFFLDYFVDFTEADFVNKLVQEINEKSGAISFEGVYEELNDNMMRKICELYNFTKDELLEYLDTNNVITRSNSFKTGGFEFIKQHYPRIFEGVNSNKVRLASDTKKKISIRTEKYSELKHLWEKLNEKVILEYKFDNETMFKNFFVTFLKDSQKQLNSIEMREKVSKVVIENNQALVNESESIYNRKSAMISTLKYSDFLKELSKNLKVNIETIHQSITQTDLEINNYLNQSSIRVLKDNFDHFLMANAFDKFSISYKKVSNSIHPTKFTNEKGLVLKEISAGDIGSKLAEEEVSKKYFFDELYFDSELEKQNILTTIEEVVVFTKIPKESIRIPIAGGKSYSPDFAYVLKFKDGSQNLNFIVETKDVYNEKILREEEKFKIQHAEEFFKGEVNVKFKAQFSKQKIVDLISEIIR